MPEKKSDGIRGEKGRFAGAQPGAGRPKGVPNKNTQQIRDMIVQALDKAGGVDYLAGLAQSNPSAFCTLIAKVVPTAVEGTVDGPAIKLTTIDAKSLPTDVLRHVLNAKRSD